MMLRTIKVDVWRKDRKVEEERHESHSFRMLMRGWSMTSSDDDGVTGATMSSSDSEAVKMSLVVNSAKLFLNFLSVGARDTIG